MEALHSTIKNELLHRIEGNVYRRGMKIPSEKELSVQFNVSAATIRRAIRMLIGEGRLEKKQHCGVAVSSRRLNHGFVAKLKSFGDEMHENGEAAITKVILARKADATKEVARHLEVETGMPVFKLLRLRYAGEVPSVLALSYIPLDLYPTIESIDFTDTSLFRFFTSVGEPVVKARRLLEVIKADQDMAALLDICESDPIYRFHSLATTVSDRVAEYAVLSYRGKSNYFEFDVTID